MASDLPITRLRELFNVNHFIVSQVNPHIVPILGVYNRFPRLVHFGVTELQFRLGQLSSLGVFPNVTRTLQAVLSQQYTGDITIVPDIGVNEYLRCVGRGGGLQGPVSAPPAHALLPGGGWEPAVCCPTRRPSRTRRRVS